ncbi:MAG TPA: hypothetical protein VF085_00665, partial [Solirubrobacterales bacterium]
MAPCAIDDFHDLVVCLQDAVKGTAPDQWIELDPGLFEQAGELAALFGEAPLTIRQRDAATPLLAVGSDSVEVSGDGPLFAAADQRYEITVTGSYDGAPVLGLKATPVGAWTFADNFPVGFPDYLGFAPPALARLPSFIPGIAFESPSFSVAPGSAALSFGADAALDKGSLAPLDEYLGPGPIHLAGPVDVRPAEKTYPKLELSGALSGWSMPSAGAPRLRIATVDAESTKPAESVIELVASTAPGNYASLEVSAPLLRAPYAWELSAEPEDPTAYLLESGLEALSDEVGMQLSLPTGLSGLGGFGLRSIMLGIAPAKRVDALGLIGLRFGTIPGAAPVWTAPILGLSLKELEIGWDIVAPLSKSSEMLGLVSGKLGVGSGAAAVDL